MEGTHSPTKIPASLLISPRNPNHRDIENRNERNAAPKINESDLVNISVMPFLKLLIWFAGFSTRRKLRGAAIQFSVPDHHRQFVLAFSVKTVLTPLDFDLPAILFGYQRNPRERIERIYNIVPPDRQVTVLCLISVLRQSGI